MNKIFHKQRALKNNIKGLVFYAIYQHNQNSLIDFEVTIITPFVLNKTNHTMIKYVRSCHIIKKYNQ